MNFELPPRRDDAHKGNFGRVLLIGGSRGMAGSIALSSIAALKTGSGLVSAAIPDRCLETVAGFHPGIMTIPLPDTDDGQFALNATLPDLAAVNAVGCGPGMRTGSGSIRIIERLLHQSHLMRVMDADAINLIASQNFLSLRSQTDSPALPSDQHLPPDQSTLVLTPHPGELARLTGVPASDRERQIMAAEELVRRWGMTIVVKGGPTVIVGRHSAPNRLDSSDVARHTNSTGNPGMATAGSGDVLTGIITSLLGQQHAAFEAACLGVQLHGLAGDLAAERDGQAGMTCVEILEQIPQAIRKLVRP